MRSRRRHLLLGAACALVLGGARAQSIEVIELRHRSAEDLLPLLRPFVETGGAISGQGSQLMVRASPANLGQLRELLATLDRPPRQLLITVRQDRAEERAQDNASTSGTVIVSSRRGVTGNATVEASNSRTVGTRNTGQTLRVMEGGRAMISIGVALPFTFKQYVPAQKGGGLTETQATAFYEAVTGFAVRPTLAGNVVTLELSPVDAVVTAQGVERAQLMTRVQGRLGEWIALGDADLREQSRRTGSAGVGTQSMSSQRGVWVKVEDANSGAAAPR
jgi:hypothetical protein